jgi:hypothetical protein
MEATSVRNQQNTPSLSEYGDEMSVEDLLKRIDDFQQIGDQETIDRLEKENAMLRHQVLCYERGWRATLDLFKEAFDAVLLIKTALQSCEEEEEKANKDWLAFWGVRMETPSNLAYQPKQWV